VTGVRAYGLCPAEGQTLYFMQNRNALQIDEQGRMTHPRRLMSLKKLILGIFASVMLLTANASEIPSGAVTLEQCIQLALENNLDVRIGYYGPQLAELSLKRLYGSQYDPRLQLGGTDSHSENKGISGIDEFPVPPSEIDTIRNNIGLSGGLNPFGTTYRVALNSSHSEGFDTRTFPVLRPNETYRAGFNASITQPLLKNGWGIAYRTNLKITKNDIKNSSLTVIQQIMNTVANIEIAYYSLIASRENVTVAEETLALTEKNFSNQKRRAEVGTLAKSQLPQLEAELFSQKASLLSVRNSYADNINSLKRLLTDDFAAAQNKELTPVGELNPVQTVFNLSDSWDKALNQRPQVIQSKIRLENNEINLKYSKNQLWPQLDLVASYGSNGTDILQSVPVFDRTDPNNPILTGYTPKKIYDRTDPNNHIFTGDYEVARFKTAFRDVRKAEYPGYSIGLTLSIPIPNRSNRAAYKSRQLQNEQALLQHKELEQSIMVEIDRLIRDAEYRFEQITVTRQARLSSELALQNETKRYNEGAIENYQVLQAQRDLTNRRYAEINAKVQYLIALSRLAQAEGSTLENNNINVDFEEE
jgi:outer membrane protein